MKLYKKIKILAIGFIMVFTVNSCTDNFEEINTNPKLIGEDLVKPDHIFAKVLKQTIFGVIKKEELAEWGGIQKSRWGNQTLGNIDWDFSGIYTNDLVNISEVIRLTADDPLLSNKNALAKIWKVWIFHQVTDRWGDVPYSEASLGPHDVIFSPKYDTQEFIYKDMMKTLKGAVAQLEQNLSNDDQLSFAASDILYGGDAKSWIRFANSLRFRLAMRVRFVDRNLAQENIDDIINGLLIDDLSQNADLLTEGEGYTDENNINPLDKSHYVGGQPRDGYLSFTQDQELKKRNDPRLQIYWIPNAKGEYRGWPLNLISENGDDDRYLLDSCNQYGDWFEQLQVKINVLTSYEVKFFKAEAALVGLISGDPNTFLQEGIQQAMEEYEIDQSVIDDYMANWGTLTGTDEEKFEEIIIQKYLAMPHQALEAWAEFRRTGYPKIWIGSNPGIATDMIPRRHAYPSSEDLKNKANKDEAASRYPGGDNEDSRVWWDANPLTPISHEKQGEYPPEIY